MAIIEGSVTPKVLIAEYDFAKEGGAIGAHTLHGISGWDNALPKGSVVIDGYLEVLTLVTSASTNTATIGLKVEATDDVFIATSVPVSGAPWSTAGRKNVIPDGTGAHSIKASVARSVVATVAVAALTAGKFRVTLFYV